MKKTLFAFAAVLMAGSSAFAMDVTNPFYVPMKGDFLSETSTVYTNLQHGLLEQAVATETLSYGVTRNLAIGATLADTWVFDRGDMTGHEKYDNPAWGVGFKYNWLDCCKTKWKVQVGADYKQGGVNPHDKAFLAFAKAGYELDKVLPYASIAVNKPAGKYEGGPIWQGRVAAYAPLAKKVNLDVGLDYEWNSDTDGSHGRPVPATRGHNRYLFADATLSYVFSDCMAVGLTGEYVLHSHVKDGPKGKENVDGYNVGVNLKVAF